MVLHTAWVFITASLLSPMQGDSAETDSVLLIHEARFSHPFLPSAGSRNWDYQGGWGSIKFLPGGSRNNMFVRCSVEEAFSGGGSPVPTHCLPTVTVDGCIMGNPLLGSCRNSFPAISLSPRRISDFDVSTHCSMGETVTLEMLPVTRHYSASVRMEGSDWKALELGDIRTGSCCGNMARLGVSALLTGPEPLASYLLPALGIHLPGDMGFLAAVELDRSGGGENGRYGWGFDQWEDSRSGAVKLSYHPSETTEFDLTISILNAEAGWFGIGDYWSWSRFETPYIETDTTSAVFGDTLAPGGDILQALPSRIWNVRTLCLGMKQQLGRGAMFRMNMIRRGSDFGHRIRSDPNSTTKWLGENWDWAQWNQYDPELMVDDDGFVRSGTYQYPWLETRTTTDMISFDIIADAGRGHTVSAGVLFAEYEIFNHDVIWNDPEVCQNRFSATPVSGGFYLQDVVDLAGGLVLKAGCRFDYFDANLSTDSEEGLTAGFQELVLDSIEPSLKLAVSPGIEMEYALAGGRTLRMGAGVRSSMPRMRYLYRRGDSSLSSSTPLGGNPDLDFQRNFHFRISFIQRFSESVQLRLRGDHFQMDRLVETVLRNHPQAGSYAIFENSGSRGITSLQAGLRGGGIDFFSWDLSYTLENSAGTSSHPLQDYVYFLSGHTNAGSHQNLNSHRRHSIKASLSLRIPDHSGPSMAGFRPLEKTTVRFEWLCGSGRPFTSAPQEAPVEVNRRRYPWEIRAELFLSRGFSVSGTAMEVWVRIENLFNRRNVMDIQDAAWYLAEESADNGDVEYYPMGPLNNPFAYCRPRSVIAGLSLNW